MWSFALEAHSVLDTAKAEKGQCCSLYACQEQETWHIQKILLLPLWYLGLLLLELQLGIHSP